MYLFSVVFYFPQIITILRAEIAFILKYPKHILGISMY